MSRLDRARLQQVIVEAALRESGDIPDWEYHYDEAELATRQVFLDILEAQISAAVAAGMTGALLDFGVDVSFDLDNPRARAYASEAAAEAVTRINQTTREELRRLITQAVADGASYTEIAKEIREKYAGFRTPQPQKHIRDRAELVAVQELGQAYEAGSYTVGEELQRAGLEMEKAWLTVGDERVSEEICRPNEQQGWIPFNDEFQSGHKRPLGHVACRCTLLQRRKPTDEPS